MYPNAVNLIVVPMTKRIEIIMCIHICLILRMNFDYRKMVERKLFLQIWTINIIYPNVENKMVLITKRMEIIMRPKFVSFLEWSFIRRKMVERKLFLQIRSINMVYPNVENLIVVPITKRIEIIKCIHVCLISRMNFDYTKNGWKKSFSCKSKASISCIPMWRQWLPTQ